MNPLFVVMMSRQRLQSTSPIFKKTKTETNKQDTKQDTKQEDQTEKKRQTCAFFGGCFNTMVPR